MADFLKKYIDDISTVEPCTKEENAFLADRLIKGDASAKTRLVEGNLRFAIEQAAKYEESGALADELVAEANVALMEAVIRYEQERVASDFEEYIAKAIDHAINEFVEAEGRGKLAAGKLEAEANRLLEITRDFEEEHERPATLEELSDLMGLEQDEIERIVRTSYSAIKLGDRS